MISNPSSFMRHRSLSFYGSEQTGEESPMMKMTVGNDPSLKLFLENGQYNSQLEDNDLKPVTKTIQKLHRNKRRYINTPNMIRVELIDAVHKHGEKIKSAAKRLGINYSSAKAMCQVFKKEGRSDKIVLKKRRSKQEPKPLEKDLSIMTKHSDSESEGSAEIKDQAYLKTFEPKQESIFSEKFILECQKAFHKEEAYLSSVKASSQLFDYLQIKKLDSISVREFLPTGFQSSYNQMTPFNMQTLQPKQELLARRITSQMPKPNLTLSQTVNYQPIMTDLELQLMQSYQNPLKQNNPCSLISNPYMNSNKYLLHQSNMGTIQQQNYALISPTVNMRPQNLNAHYHYPQWLPL